MRPIRATDGKISHTFCQGSVAAPKPAMQTSVFNHLPPSTLRPAPLTATILCGFTR
jgi:hypothetical protein